MRSEVAALPEALRPVELTEGPVSLGGLDDQVLEYPESKPPRAWYLAFAVTSALTGIGFALIG